MFKFSSILDLFRAFPDEQSCIDYLENIRWNGVIISPFDNTSKVYKCKENRYKCKNTGKYFNVRTNLFSLSSKILIFSLFVSTKTIILLPFSL